MPTSLALADHIRALEVSAAALADGFRSAGPSAPVPTCPDWTVLDLVVHQAMVHRWAAGHLRGQDAPPEPDVQEIGAGQDLLQYYLDGVEELLTCLRQSDPGVQAMTFLRDAPEPLQFWARRQAHETTIHGVDALAAALQRTPSSAEVGISAELAADGIDELLRGFLTRGPCKLYAGEEFSVVVAPTDASLAWTMRVGPRLVTEIGVDHSADVRLEGSAVQLYLGLWNRGDEIREHGDRGVLTAWREREKVTWS